MTPRNLLMSAGLAALLAGAGTAQSTGDTGTATGEAPAIGTTETDPGAAAPAPEFTSLEEMTVGDVVGLNVVSPDGDTIGDIDYVIQGANGAAAVIGVGGFLGLGEHTVALPLGDFAYDAEQRVLTLGTDKETLEAQPELDESNLESLPDETPVATLMEPEAGSGSGEAGDDAGMSDQGSAEEDATEDGAAIEGAEGDAAEDPAMTDDAAADEGSASATEDAAGDAGSTEESAVEGDAAEDGATEELEEETQSSDG